MAGKKLSLTFYLLILTFKYKLKTNQSIIIVSTLISDTTTMVLFVATCLINSRYYILIYKIIVAYKSSVIVSM